MTVLHASERMLTAYPIALHPLNVAEASQVDLSIDDPFFQLISLLEAEDPFVMTISRLEELISSVPADGPSAALRGYLIGIFDCRLMYQAVT
jgi:hypothetical protein